MDKVTLRFVREEDEQLAVLETLIRETAGEEVQTPSEPTIPAQPRRGRLEQVALFATTLVVGVVVGLTAVSMWVAPHWMGAVGSPGAASGMAVSGAKTAPKAMVRAGAAPAVTYTVVQAGVFAQRASATQMAAELRKRGLPAVVADATNGTGAGRRYRLLAAVAGSRAEAVSLAQRLAAQRVVSYVTDVTLPRVSAPRLTPIARANTTWLHAAIPAVNAQLAVRTPRPFSAAILRKITTPHTTESTLKKQYTRFNRTLAAYQKHPNIKQLWALQHSLLQTLAYEQTLRQSP